MDLRQLGYFLSIVEHGSVGKAAEHLRITQPALSKSIRRLEEDLEVKLFERHPAGMVPTVYGLALAEKGRPISLEVRNVMQELEELRDLHRGSVVVGTGPSMAGHLLAQAASGLAIRRPNLSVTVIEGHHELLSGVRDGRIDMFIGSMRPEFAAQGIQSEPLLLDDEICVIARKHHPLTKVQAPELATLTRYSWILAYEADALRGRLQRIFTDAGLPPPTSKTISSSAHFIKALLMSTDCLAYLPRVLIALEEKAGLLAPLNIPKTSWKRSLHVARRAHGNLSPAARALLNEIKAISASRRVSAKG